MKNSYIFYNAKDNILDIKVFDDRKEAYSFQINNPDYIKVNQFHLEVKYTNATREMRSK